MEDQPFSLAKVDLNIKADLSASFNKLVDTVSSAIGTFYAPTHVRRMAKAEDDALTLCLEGDLHRHELVLRTAERLSYVELRRQENIEAVVNQAALQLPETVSDKPVDEDWAVQFFEHSQDVGDEEMQMLWAQLLAGEVEQPGSFSLRTLHTVKLLKRDDALLFRKVSRYLWKIENAYFHYYTAGTDNILKEHDKIGHVAFLQLEALGLLSFRSDTILQIESHDPWEIAYCGMRHRLSRPENRGLQELMAYPLTDVGKELMLLCDIKPNESYRIASVESWRKSGLKVELLDSDVETEPEGA